MNNFYEEENEDFAAEDNTAETISLTVSNELAGMRLDAAIAKMLPEYRAAALPLGLKMAGCNATANPSRQKKK